MELEGSATGEGEMDHPDTASLPEQRIQAAKKEILMLRLANLVGAQREMEQRAKLTDTLQQAYDRLGAVEDALRQTNGESVQSFTFITGKQDFRQDISLYDVC